MSRFGLLALGCHLSVAVLLAVSVAACGTDDSREPESPTASETATGPTGDDTAGRVALTYMRAIIRNDYDAALPLVASNQREVLKALAVGQGPGTQPTLSADLEVGDVAVSGANATVTLVGSMCRTPARRNGARPRTECVENQDPKSDSPEFRIRMVQDAGWKVAFGSPGTDGSGP